MTAAREPAPKDQFFDNNGLPLNGGFVFTYAAGTSTPLATYTDYTGNTANSNPVQLDSSGRPVFGLWYSSSLYKIVVTDRNGVQLYSVDDFPGSASGGTSGITGPFGPATNIASGTLVDLGTVSGNFANITGTITINNFGSTATTDNPIYLVKFNNTLTITNSANILIRAGVTSIGNNLVTASGDYAWLEYLGSGSWKIFQYARSDGSISATNITVNNLTVLNQADLP